MSSMDISEADPLNGNTERDDFRSTQGSRP